MMIEIERRRREMQEENEWHKREWVYTTTLYTSPPPHPLFSYVEKTCCSSSLPHYDPFIQDDEMSRIFGGFGCLPLTSPAV